MKKIIIVNFCFYCLFCKVISRLLKREFPQSPPYFQARLLELVRRMGSGASSSSTFLSTQNVNTKCPGALPLNQYPPTNVVDPFSFAPNVYCGTSYETNTPVIVQPTSTNTNAIANLSTTDYAKPIIKPIMYTSSSPTIITNLATPTPITYSPHVAAPYSPILYTPSSNSHTSNNNNNPAFSPQKHMALTTQSSRASFVALSAPQSLQIQTTSATITKATASSSSSVINMTPIYYPMASRVLNTGITESTTTTTTTANSSNISTSFISTLFQNMRRPCMSLTNAMRPILEGCRSERIPGVETNTLETAVELAIQSAMLDSTSMSSSILNGLNIDEIASIKIYTMGIEPERSSLFFILNRALREENNNSSNSNIELFMPYILLFLHALKKAPQYTGRVVFRGVKENLLSVFKAGTKTVTWPTFTSCTNTVNVLNNPSFLGTNGSRTLFTIELTTNRARILSSLSMFSAENEVILPLNLRFEVVSVLGPSSDGLLSFHRAFTFINYRSAADLNNIDTKSLYFRCCITIRE
eukprot:gene9584-19921_t